MADWLAGKLERIIYGFSTLMCLHVQALGHLGRGRGRLLDCGRPTAWCAWPQLANG